MKKALIFSLIALLLPAPGYCREKPDYNSARDYYLKSQYTKSIQSLEAILDHEKDTPSEARVYYLLGLSYLKDGNYLRSSDCFDIIVNEYPDSGLSENAWFKSIDSLILNSQIPEAVEMIRQAKRHLTSPALKQDLAVREELAIKNNLSPVERDVLHQDFPAESLKAGSIVYGKESLENNLFYSVQVGAFKDQSRAQALALNLKAKGFESFIEEFFSETDKFYRVKVGRFGQKSQAESVVARLKEQGLAAKVYLDTKF